MHYCVTDPLGPGVVEVFMTEVNRFIPSSPKYSAKPDTFWFRKMVSGKWLGLALCHSATRPRQLEKVLQVDLKSTSGSCRTCITNNHADMHLWCCWQKCLDLPE